MSKSIRTSYKHHTVMELVERGWFEHQGCMMKAHHDTVVYMPIWSDRTCDTEEMAEVDFFCISDEDADTIREKIGCAFLAEEHQIEADAVQEMLNEEKAMWLAEVTMQEYMMGGVE